MFYLLEKTLVLSIICSKCKNEEKFLKNLNKNINWYIENSWFNWKYISTFKMWLEKTSQEFRLKDFDETKHKKVCTTLNYFEHFPI